MEQLSGNYPTEKGQKRQQNAKDWIRLYSVAIVRQQTSPPEL